MEGQGGADSIGQLATDYLARLVDSNERVVDETAKLISVFAGVRRAVYAVAAFLVSSHIVIACIAVHYISADTRLIVQPPVCAPCALCAPCASCDTSSTAGP